MVKTRRSAPLLSGLLLATLAFSTTGTGFAKDGNEVNLGEADSHLKVQPSPEDQTTKSDSAASDSATKDQKPTEITNKEFQPEPLPHKKPAPDDRKTIKPPLP